MKSLLAGLLRLGANPQGELDRQIGPMIRQRASAPPVDRGQAEARARRYDMVRPLADPGPSPVTATVPPDLGLAGQPHLVFQPAVDLATGRLLGFEALLRWNDGSGGHYPPETLIPWAEAHGLVSDLNAWVLTEACTQATLWPLNLQIAVNCSLFQLGKAAAAMAAARALEHSGLLTDRLTIEITESTIADDDSEADLSTMARLGIQLTVDDVGKNWSILERIPPFMVNTIKIDRTLIGALEVAEGSSRTVVETIVKMSRSLGICTVAEAVETAQQVAVLREIGVDVAQGYFFSAPLAADQAHALAAQESTPIFPLVDHAPADESVDPSSIGEPTGEDDRPAPVGGPPRLRRLVGRRKFGRR